MQLQNELKAITLVIFGITGDLARRKLLPALYHLAKYDLLPAQYKIVGVSRREISAADVLASISENVKLATGKPADIAVLKTLGQNLALVQMDLTRGDDYARLHQTLGEVEAAAGVCMTRLFYMAVPFQTLPQIVAHLGENGLQRGCNHDVHAENRLLIEKPFGDNLATAKALVQSIGQYFAESQLYRIDHYLAKETAQNMLTFRFQNPLFKAVWNRSHIKSVMITAAETIGIEGRSVFYEQTGALRDFIQNHLLQLLALTAMDEPKSMSAADIHHEKLKLLDAVAPIAPNEVAGKTVRGQYAGYRTEVNNPGSQAETYAAVQLAIDNERFRGVPILLRTGKALAEKVAEITIIFGEQTEPASETSPQGKAEHSAAQTGAEHSPHVAAGHSFSPLGANTLTIRIQPNEGIVLGLRAKKPGFRQGTEHVQMEFCYNRAFAGEHASPDAYERVLVDAFRGDKTLFATDAEVLASWRIIENVITEWAKNGDDLHVYPKGSWGPAAAEELARRAGVTWMTDVLNICPA